MLKKIYVGNLPFSATEREVRDLFEQYGPVETVSLVSDRQTGQPRGFGFVEMAPENADKAIEALDQTEFGGRQLKINEARSQDRGPRGKGGGGGGRPRRW